MEPSPRAFLAAHPRVVVAALALATTAVLGTLAARIGSDYHRHHPWFFDPVSYAFQNAVLHERVREEGRWAVALAEARENGRHPGRTIPLILLAPSLLGHPMGHLATSLPALACFLGLFGWWAYRRSGHPGLACAGILLVAALPGLLHPEHGLPAYWLDLPAALWGGCAAICLLLAGRKAGWYIAFGIFASFASWCRYIAAGYLLVLCAPILAMRLRENFLEEPSWRNSVVRPLAWIAAAIGLLAGPYLIAHAAGSLGFYSTYGYALGQGPRRAALSLAKGILQFLGKGGAVLLPALGVASAVVFASRTASWRQAVPLFWLATGHLLFAAGVLQVAGHGPTAWYALPGLLMLALLPLPWSADPERRAARNVFAGALAALGLFVAIGNAWQASHEARTPKPSGEARKRMDLDLARHLAPDGKPLVWNAFFDEYSWIPSVEAFFRTGRLPLPAGQGLFTVHESGWKGMYPGVDKEELASRVLETASREVGIAVVFADPRDAAALGNPWTRAVAARMAERLPGDSRWVRLFEMDSPAGKLAGFRNLRPSRDAYPRLLRGERILAR